MEYRVLGALTVVHGDSVLALRPGRSQSLLLWLLLARGGVVPAELLQDRLWAEHETPENPQNALQTQVSYLRRMFATVGESPLETRGPGYSLRVDHADVDAARFERLLEEGRRIAGRQQREDLEAAADVLDEALGLWRGEPLVELRGHPDVLGEVTRLQEMRLAALELRAEVALGLGSHAAVLAELQGLVAEFPLREKLHELLMLALYRSGRQSEALQAYQHVRSMLIDELGIEPGTALADMERRVLAQDPSLDIGTAVRADTSAAGGRGAEATPAAASPLPVEVGPLVGRDSDVATLHDLLAAHRVVTLTGPGGVGKTRVALAVARRQVTASVWFVDLSHVTDDRAVSRAVATVLGVSTRPDVDVLEALTAEVPRQGLLVLDTCEQVVDGVAEVVSGLTRAWPDLRVLATSRRPLQVPGELARPVLPLALPNVETVSAAEVLECPSVQLFVQRATAVRPDLVLDEDDAGEVAALCRDLDGLPLAIELAAAQSDVLSPSAIRQLLTERFDLLVTEARGAQGRHRGLRATIDWSIALLTEEQRVFFGRLAVFPASFDLAAVAAATAYPPGRAVRLVTALVRNSLVHPVAGDRFVLLDSLRDYAGDLLAADEARDEVVGRLASFYGSLVSEAESHVRMPEQGVWWARLRAELPNFRAALDWSFAHGDRQLAARMTASLTWVWIHDGMLDEADTWMRHAVAVAGLDDASRAQVLIHSAMLASAIGRFEPARHTASEAIDVARSAGDAQAVGIALTERGMAEWALGDLRAAAATHDEAIDVLEAAGAAWGAAFATMLRARTAIDAQDPQAAELATRCARAAQHTGDRALTGVAYQQLSLLALLRGDLDEAARTADEALHLEEAVAYQEGIAASVHLQGRVALARGEHGQAYRLFLRTLRSGQRLGHVAIICQALEYLATTLAAAKQSARALALLDLAARTREARQMPARAPEDQEVRALRARLHEVPVAQPTPTYLVVEDALVDLPEELTTHVVADPAASSL